MNKDLKKNKSPSRPLTKKVFPDAAKRPASAKGRGTPASASKKGAAVSAAPASKPSEAKKALD